MRTEGPGHRVPPPSVTGPGTLQVLGREGGRVLPAQGAHGPMVEAAAIVPRVRVCWRMSVHRRLNRKHFHFFTLLSIMLGETPLSCPLAFLGGFHGFLSPLGAHVV